VKIRGSKTAKCLLALCLQGKNPYPSTQNLRLFADGDRAVSAEKL